MHANKAVSLRCLVPPSTGFSLTGLSFLHIDTMKMWSKLGAKESVLCLPVTL